MKDEVVGYLRVSTERQAGEVVTSLADQQHAIDQLAARMGLEVDRWYRDEGASGATAEGRPAFARLLADCAADPRQRQPGHVLVLNDSRFGRFSDPEESAYWRHHLRRLGWIVRFAEGDESQDKTARSVMRAIGAAQATEYRDNIRRNARRGARGAAELGYWTREAPFGYRRKVVHPAGRERVLDVGQLKAPDEKVRLTPHADEASIVRWAYEQYATGTLSAVRLVPELKRRVPARKWSARHVQALLQNPAYCGDVVGGKRPALEDRGQMTTRPETEWYGMRDAHEPVVPRALWLEVQRRLSQNANRGKAVHATYLLSGLMYCPHCGSKYTGGGGGRNAKFYKCSGGATGTCPGKIGCISRHLVDGAVIDTLARTLRSRTVQAQVERTIDAALSRAPAQVAESEATLRVARRKATDRRDRLVALLADGTLQPDEAAPQLEGIRADVAEMDSRIESLRFRARSVNASDEQRDRLWRAMNEFGAVAARVEGPELRALVEPWIVGAEFDKVSRDLTLQIARLPALQGLQPHTPPGLVDRLEAPLIRRVSLAQRQPGQPVRPARRRAS